MNNRSVSVSAIDFMSFGATQYTVYFGTNSLYSPLYRTIRTAVQYEGANGKPPATSIVDYNVSVVPVNQPIQLDLLHDLAHYTEGAPSGAVALFAGAAVADLDDMRYTGIVTIEAPEAGESLAPVAAAGPQMGIRLSESGTRADISAVDLANMSTILGSIGF